MPSEVDPLRGRLPGWAWKTHIFSGSTPEEATKAFDTWLGYGNQPILCTSTGTLCLYVSHVPWADRYQIHVTALMKVDEL